MFMAVVERRRKFWLLEASDGRRFGVSGRKEVKVVPEGSETPVLSGRGLSFKAARRLLEVELGHQEPQAALLTLESPSSEGEPKAA